MTDSASDLSIYLHWPFCRSKCPYCDFFSRVQKNVDQNKIIDGYLNQLEKYKELLPERKIISVFFGGGTPSLIQPQNIERILNKITALWPTDEHIEITLEANPNTQTPTLFADLRQSGINRLSLGVQSLDDQGLKFLGRTHTAREALSAIDSVLKNFDNHSVDLIYALPNQTLAGWQKQLDTLCAFGLKHISLYQLTIEENTLFFRKNIKPLDEEKAIELYAETEKFLAPKGYLKYEVSNYAQNGFASKHNLVYWTGRDYIGIGQTAHGRFKKGNRFFAQTDLVHLEELSPEERAEELILMGLRLTKGLNKDRFAEIIGQPLETFLDTSFKKEALSENLIEETNNTLKASAKGFLLLDYILPRLVA